MEVFQPSSSCGETAVAGVQQFRLSDVCVAADSSPQLKGLAPEEAHEVI